ncbi:MAG: VOC family protein, partial [Chitinophagaceae bacterium]
KLFLGIDHTAIGVSNTEVSHRFYADLLGLDRKGDSWNKGIEQEHLNNVQGASLHITGYRSLAGPGVEFLEYILPGPGKKYPEDTRSDDLWFWQTILITDNSKLLLEKLKASNYSFLSKEPIFISKNNPYSLSFIVKDPDGHALLIVGSKN